MLLCNLPTPNGNTEGWRTQHFPGVKYRIEVFQNVRPFLLYMRPFQKRGQLYKRGIPMAETGNTVSPRLIVSRTVHELIRPFARSTMGLKLLFECRA